MNGPESGGERLALAMLSDTGRCRRRNEDVVAGNAALGWALVADGMGGHRGGDVASALAAGRMSPRLDRLMASPPAPEALGEALREIVGEANRAILAHAERDPSLAGMGSTVVVAARSGELMVFAHVGDSRAYHYDPAAGLRRLTTDHSLLQELIEGGMISEAEARCQPVRGVLTRSLGAGEVLEVDVGRVTLAPGELLMLCSDGLTEMLDERELAEVLAGGGGLADLAARLVGRANAAGGRDNVSVVLMAAGEGGGRADGRDTDGARCRN